MFRIRASLQFDCTVSKIVNVISAKLHTTENSLQVESITLSAEVSIHLNAAAKWGRKRITLNCNNLA